MRLSKNTTTVRVASDRKALVRAIQQNPWELTYRKGYLDWLEEQDGAYVESIGGSSTNRQDLIKKERHLIDRVLEVHPDNLFRLAQGVNPNFTWKSVRDDDSWEIYEFPGRYGKVEVQYSKPGYDWTHVPIQLAEHGRGRPFISVYHTSDPERLDAFLRDFQFQVRYAMPA